MFKVSDDVKVEDLLGCIDNLYALAVCEATERIEFLIKQVRRT